MFPTINRASNFYFLIDPNTEEVGAKIFGQRLNCVNSKGLIVESKGLFTWLWGIPDGWSNM